MRIKQMILFCLLVLFTVLFAQEKQAKLAVMEIEDKSGKLSKALLENAAEALRTEIGATNKFVLISKDRQRKAMIKGQKKESWKECYDQSCRIELGQALTADRILTGIVTYFGKKYILTAELIDLAKEATVKTAKAEFDGTEVGLSEAISSIATQIAGVRKAGSAFQTGKTGEKVEEWEIGQGEETIVKFDSKPGEAVVIVDGKILCQKTPCSKMLTQGKHEITIQKENFLPKTKVFDIVKGRPPLIAELEPDFGYLSVASEPEGIEVLLDGKNIGKTPVEKVVLSPGAHQVETNDSCYYQTGEKFTTKRGESKSIRLDIKPKESGIKVTAQDKEGNDLEADILVDGKNIGTAPGTYKVPLCAKELVVQTKGLVYKEVLALKEKQVETFSAVLKSKERYEIREGAVMDNDTGLMWERKGSPNPMNHQDAIKYCEDLSLGGYSDWRLPSISELKTLILGCQSGTEACKLGDRGYRSEACYCKAANQGPGEYGYYWQKGIWQAKGIWFWSSSVVLNVPENAWYVPFEAGTINSRYRSSGCYARCARGEMKKK